MVTIKVYQALAASASLPGATRLPKDARWPWGTSDLNIVVKEGKQKLKIDLDLKSARHHKNVAV